MKFNEGDVDIRVDRERVKDLKPRLHLNALKTLLSLSTFSDSSKDIIQEDVHNMEASKKKRPKLVQKTEKGKQL